MVELLLILILEGRKALPKVLQPLVSQRLETFPGDRGHRQIVEAIRSGNNDDFFEAMEAGMKLLVIDALLLTTHLHGDRCIITDDSSPW